MKGCFTPAIFVLSLIILASCGDSAGESSDTLLGTFVEDIQDFEISRKSGGRLSSSHPLYFSTAISVWSNRIAFRQSTGSRNCSHIQSLTPQEFAELRKAFQKTKVCGQRSESDPPAFDQASATIRWNRSEWDKACQDNCDAIDERIQNLNTLDFTGADWASDRFRLCDGTSPLFDLLKQRYAEEIDSNELDCPLRFDFFVSPRLQVGGNGG